MSGSNSPICVFLYKLRRIPPFSFLPVVTALTIVEFIVVIPGLFGLSSELLDGGGVTRGSLTEQEAAPQILRMVQAVVFTNLKE